MSEVYREKFEDGYTQNIFIDDIPEDCDKFLFVKEKICVEDIPETAIFLFDSQLDKMCLRCRIIWYEDGSDISYRHIIPFEQYTLKEFNEKVEKTEKQDHGFLSEAAELMNDQPVPTEDRMYYDAEQDKVVAIPNK